MIRLWINSYTFIIIICEGSNIDGYQPTVDKSCTILNLISILTLAKVYFVQKNI